MKTLDQTQKKNLKIDEKDDTHCSMCPQSFSCVRLKCAIKLLDEKLVADKASHENVRVEFERLKASLQSHGWFFPFNQKDCDFEDIKNSLNETTYNLIELLNKEAS